MTRKALSSIAVALVTIAGVTLVPPAAARAAGGLPSLGLAPVSEIPPSIGGSAAVGSMIVCSQGQWLNGPTTYLYSWQRDLITTVSGPSSANSYEVTAADLGALVTCTVTATNAAGSGVGVSIPGNARRRSDRGRPSQRVTSGDLRNHGGGTDRHMLPRGVAEQSDGVRVQLAA